jgi:aminoglycoside phosphotransferase (APT) family kinase protein
MTNEPEAVPQDEEDVREMARAIVQHHFGRRPRRLLRQGSGLSNFVFLVKHAREEFVVRLSLTPTQLNAYIKEQWAIEKASAAGVPTPEILEVGNEVVPYPYMISRKVRGQEATGHPARLAILREMGRYAALINSVPTTSFGNTFDWSRNQLSRNETWRDFLEREWNIEAQLAVLEKHRMLTPSQLKALCATLKRLADQKFEPALNHGDLRLKNVIVNESGEIAAIIDWETCISTLAPHWDLSIALHDLSIDEKQEFLAGYGLSASKMADIAPMVKAINLINYAPKIERFAEAKDTARLEQYRTRLHGHLDLYSL